MTTIASRSGIVRPPPDASHSRGSSSVRSGLATGEAGWLKTPTASSAPDPTMVSSVVVILPPPSRVCRGGDCLGSGDVSHHVLGRHVTAHNVGRHLAQPKHDQPVGHVEDLLQIVAYDHHSEALLP